MTFEQTLVVTVLGFLLTTVLGGSLGAFLQRRFWLHQWKVQRLNKIHEEARAVFEEVSRILDKRLFRLSQFKTWIKRGHKDMIEISLQNYREIVMEWNDSINRNLSLIHFYFGEEVREEYDYNLGKDFVDAGVKVENLFRNIGSNDDRSWDELDQIISRLRSNVYKFNLKMLANLSSLGEYSRFSKGSENLFHFRPNDLISG